MDSIEVIQYILLNIFLLFVFFLVGKNISKGGDYWRSAIWAILFFVLIFGSRYGRGNDYFHYVDVYRLDLEESQRLFTWFNHVLQFLGVGPHYFFFFYAIPFVTFSLVLLEPMKKYAIYLFPLYIVANSVFEEFIIRQALSYSFVFLFMYELSLNTNRTLNFKIPYLLLYFLCSYSIHSANGLIVLIFLALFLFVKRPISIFITAPLFIFFSYVFPIFLDSSGIATIFEILASSGDEKFQGYNDNVDFWTNLDRDGAEQYIRTPLIRSLETFGNLSLIILGTKLFEEKVELKKYLPFFYLYIIGTYIGKGFMTLEIFRRMGDVMMRIWFIPLALVLFYFPTLQLKSRCRFLYKILFVGLAFWIWDYFRYVFMKGNMILFMWNIDNY